MERLNRNIVAILVIAIISVVSIATINKVGENHTNSLYLVVERKIEESARECFLDESCTGTETTLGFLTRKGYLEPQTNPVTKEVLSNDTKIKYDGENCTVNIRG